jgi:hypothetical protein
MRGARPRSAATNARAINDRRFGLLSAGAHDISPDPTDHDVGERAGIGNRAVWRLVEASHVHDRTVRQPDEMPSRLKRRKLRSVLPEAALPLVRLIAWARSSLRGESAASDPFVDGVRQLAGHFDVSCTSEPRMARRRRRSITVPPCENSSLLPATPVASRLCAPQRRLERVHQHDDPGDAAAGRKRRARRPGDDADDDHRGSGNADHTGNP